MGRKPFAPKGCPAQAGQVIDLESAFLLITVRSCMHEGRRSTNFIAIFNDRLEHAEDEENEVAVEAVVPADSPLSSVMYRVERSPKLKAKLREELLGRIKGCRLAARVCPAMNEAVLREILEGMR